VTKIAIATPAYGEIFYAPYVQSLFRLVKAFEHDKIASSFASISYADIVESRSFLLTRWYDKTDATHLLFLDADMGFEPRVVLDMLALDKPLVGVVYPKREIDLERYAKLVAEGRSAENARARAHNYIFRKNGRSGLPDRNGFIEVDGCGAGILLVRRDCIDGMLARFPELSDSSAKKTSPIARDLDRLIRAFEPIMLDGARLSEDYAFCHRWRQCGGEVWANIAHEISHIGLHRFKGRYKDARGGPRITLQTDAAPATKAPRTVTRGQLTIPAARIKAAVAPPGRKTEIETPARPDKAGAPRRK
jgi:hypothetical protein